MLTVIKADGSRVQFSIDILYASVCRAVRVTRGWDRPGEIIAKSLTKNTMKTLGDWQELETATILKAITYVSSKYYYTDIAEYFHRFIDSQDNNTDQQLDN